MKAAAGPPRAPVPPVPPGPRGLARLAAQRLRTVVRALPTEPPSLLVARALDRLLWPRLDAGQRHLLAGRGVEVEVVELGLRVRLRLGARGFELAPRGEACAVRIRARAGGLWQLLRGEQDADRLFFEQALVLEGDTEFGLVLKNTLDAIGPLWR